ncbi:MAG: hypothetical protein EOO14_03345 [Chitinophagaceae bacterium]|nr:MAG: hypothetical protein EOO14_03345 [Chitinophagaceae bacterium]
MLELNGIETISKQFPYLPGLYWLEIAWYMKKKINAVPPVLSPGKSYSYAFSPATVTENEPVFSTSIQPRVNFYFLGFTTSRFAQTCVLLHSVNAVCTD